MAYVYWRKKRVKVKLILPWRHFSLSVSEKISSVNIYEPKYVNKTKTGKAEKHMILKFGWFNEPKQEKLKVFEFRLT